jgi:hypothetical protein
MFSRHGYRRDRGTLIGHRAFSNQKEDHGGKFMKMIAVKFYHFGRRF